VYRRRRWFQGRPIRGVGVADIGWFTPDGHEMTEDDWLEGSAKSLAVFLNGKTFHDQAARGEPVADDCFYLFFNAHHEPLTFTPGRECGDHWMVILDTAAERFDGSPRPRAGESIRVEGRSLVVLRSPA
jgi:isoamylase